MALTTHLPRQVEVSSHEWYDRLLRLHHCQRWPFPRRRRDRPLRRRSVQCRRPATSPGSRNAPSAGDTCRHRRGDTCRRGPELFLHGTTYPEVLVWGRLWVRITAEATQICTVQVGLTGYRLPCNL